MATETITVPRFGGGTLIIDYTPGAVILGGLVMAYRRDNKVTATRRDNVASVTRRDNSVSVRRRG